MPDIDEELRREFGGVGQTSAQTPSANYNVDAEIRREFGGGVSTEEYVARSRAAGLAAGRSADEQAAILRKKGLPETAVNSLIQDYKLDQAAQNLGRFAGGKETVAGSMLHQAREHFIPFRSWFVNPEQGEHEANQRFQQGVATDADIQVLARARRNREDEQKLHETVAGQVIAAARDAPAIMGEYMAGSGLLKATGALQAERVSSLGQLLSGAGRTAVVTAAMPSMYMEDARQKNIAAGRDPNDWRGLGPAGLHAFAQMVVLGRVFKGAAEPAPGLVGGARAAAGAGLAGGVEMALADSVTHLADLFVPEAYKISSGDGTFEKLLKGDVSGALRKYAVDATTLAMFAGIHRLADGLSPTEAAEKAKDALETIKDVPPETVSDIKALIRANPGTVPEVVNRVADPEFRAAYREAVKRVHPDRGGSVEQFQALQDAFKAGDVATIRRIAGGETVMRYEPPAAREPVAEIGPSDIADVRLATAVERRAQARAAEALRSARQRGIPEDQSLAYAAEAYREAGGKGRESVLAGRSQPATTEAGRPEPPPEPTKPSETPTPAPKPPESPTAAPKAPVGEAAPKPEIAEPAKAETAAPAPEAAPSPAVEAPSRHEKKFTSGQKDYYRNEIRPELNVTVDRLIDSLNLAPEEALIVKGMAVGHAPAGTKMASAMGYSREGVNKMAARAMEKVREQVPELADYIGRIQNPAAGRRGTGGANFLESPEGKAAEAIRTDPTLSDAQRAEYTEAVGRVFDALPQAALDLVGKNMQGVKFYGTPQEAAIAQARGMLARTDISPKLRERIANDLNRWLAGGRVDAVGGFDGTTMHIDGSAGKLAMGGRYGEMADLSSHQIAAHEMGHAIDGPDHTHSGSSGWRYAWGKDIQGRGLKEKPLTDYAVSMASEGFAEFARLVYASDVPTERIARDFPEASKYFKKHGLWPAERLGMKSGIDEVFNRRVGDEKSAAHLDIGEDAGFLRLPTAEDFGRLKDVLWRGGEWLKWAAGGKSGNPPGVIIDRANPNFPDIQAGNWNDFKKIVADPQGVGRIPGLNWLFDPGRTDPTPEGEVFVGNQAMKEIGKNVATLWGVQNAGRWDASFKADENGQYTRGDGTKGYIEDDFRKEMLTPGSVKGLSADQLALVKEWKTELLPQAVERLKSFGINEITNQDGTKIHVDQLVPMGFFPRQVIGKEGFDVELFGSSRGERVFETEEAGATAKDRIIYDPSVASRVMKFMSGVYSMGANHKMATDPALRGETVSQRFERFKADRQAVLDDLDTKIDAATKAKDDAALKSAKAAKEDILTELRERADYPVLGKEAKVENAGALFRGKIFPKEIADRISTMMLHEDPKSWTSKIATFNQNVKSVALGGDASYTFMQLLPTMFRHPVIWAKSMVAAVKSLRDPALLSKWIEQPEYAKAAREIVQVGGSVGRLQEFLSGLKKGELVTRIPVLGKFYEVTGRAFGVAMDVAKLELWRAYKPMADKRVEKLRAEMVARGEDPRGADNQYRSLMEGIDNMLMSGRMSDIGLSPRRQLGERILGLAPSYYRGGASFIATAFQRGLAGDITRQALGATAAGVLIASVAGMKAMGLTDDEVEERLNPARGKFLKVPVDLGNNEKVEVGFGNILVGYARLAGAAADHFGSDKPIDTGADGNPILRWLRGKAATSPRLMIDLWTGKDYFGQREEPQTALLKAVEPIAIQQMIHGDHAAFEKGIGEPQVPQVATVADAVVSLFGLTSFAGSDADARRAVYDDEARKQHGKPYGELTIREQAQVVKAAEKRGDFPARKPTTADEMERAFAVGQNRVRELVNSLSDDARGKLDALGEDVPTPAATVTVNGVKVPLGDARMRTYQQLLSGEYDRVIRTWDVSNLKGMTPDVRKKWIDNQLRLAGERARRKLTAGS